LKGAGAYCGGLPHSLLKTQADDTGNYYTLCGTKIKKKTIRYNAVYNLVKHCV